MKKTINNNKVIIINGTGGVGKTTFVNLCSKYCSKVMNVSMVSLTKEIAKSIGWNNTKYDKDRIMLSELKDTIDKWDNCSFKYVEKYIMSCKNKIIFVDSRQPEDIEKLKSHFNATTLLIQNSNISINKSNHADANVLDYNYDWYIYNDGTLEDLKYKAIMFMREEVLNETDN